MTIHYGIQVMVGKKFPNYLLRQVSRIYQCMPRKMRRINICLVFLVTVNVVLLSFYGRFLCLLLNINFFCCLLLDFLFLFFSVCRAVWCYWGFCGRVRRGRDSAFWFSPSTSYIRSCIRTRIISLFYLCIQLLVLSLMLSILLEVI